MKRAYVSALGVMGRRHVVGLVRNGYDVDCFDPSAEAHKALAADLDRLKLSGNLTKVVTGPSGSYAAAIFSEHADLRFANVRAFLEKASASKIMLEKPLSSNPDEVAELPALFAAKGVALTSVSGNFTRRAWAPMQRLKALCDAAGFVTMSVHGGAYGLGGNGVHHFDLFLFLTGDIQTTVTSSRLFETRIMSGRGERFADYGGHVVLENARGMMTSLCVPTASVAPVMTVAGEHFSARIDERTLDWELAVRNPASKLPVYRCGADYEVEARGVMDYVPMDQVSGLWAEGKIVLPGLETVTAAHDLLHSALEMGGATKPFRYT